MIRALAAALLLFAAPLAAHAQRVLPPIPPTRAQGAAAGGRIFVRSFRLSGTGGLSQERLGAVVAPYLNQELDAGQLAELRDSLNRAFAVQGYVASTAEIPPQDVADGEIEIRVNAGRLGRISVEGAERLDPDWIRGRLAWAARTPLDRNALAHELEALRAAPQIARIAAELKPGDGPGVVDLDVRIEEAPATWLEAHGANDVSPALGGAAGGLNVGRYGLLGRGDLLTASFDAGRGLADYTASYSIPVHPSGTELEAHFQRTDSHIVEQPFADLDVDSHYRGYGFELRQPFYRDLNQQLWAGLRAERRSSKTFLLDEPFGFAPGHANGSTRLNVLRAFGDWTFRARDRVVALRSTVSLGRDLNHDSAGGSELADLFPDERFVAWLGQAQWVERLPLPVPGSQLVGRVDLQATGNTLSSLEQLSLGGLRTVRGYPENSILRDSGVIASLELRVPIWRSALGEDRLQLAPFFDYGQAWNSNGVRFGPRAIDSAGVGLRFQPLSGMLFAVYWGGRLRDVPETSNDLQRAGFSLEARFNRSF